MKNVGIDDGDSVLIKVQTIANIGDIVVAIDDSGQTTLKRLMFNGKRYYLHPENPNYNDIYLSDFSIQGVAKKVIKDLWLREFKCRHITTIFSMKVRYNKIVVW